MVALLAAVGSGVVGAWSTIRRRRERADRMQADLRQALSSRDVKRLEDFLVLWGDSIPKVTREHVEQRRDALFIEGDMR